VYGKEVGKEEIRVGTHRNANNINVKPRSFSSSLAIWSGSCARGRGRVVVGYEVLDGRMMVQESRANESQALK